MDGYIGEVRMFAGNFAPVNWHFCDGSLLAISQFQALFSIIGNNYGGDGRTNMGLPDYRGVFPIGFGTNKVSGISYPVGLQGGSSSRTITVSNLPPHSHSLNATNQAGNTSDPTNAILADTSGLDKEYAGSVAPNVNMLGSAIGQTGGGQSLDITPPFQALSFIICLNGLYPSRS